MNEPKKLTPVQLGILQHTLGTDKYGRIPRYSQRNHYATEPGTPDFAQCEALVNLGFMSAHGAQTVWGGMHAFTVTDTGRRIMREESHREPVLTRSQKRYREYLRAELSLSFGEWLKWQHARSRAR